MNKNYFFVLLFTIIFSATNAQDKVSDNLGFYPNPVTNGKIYITSRSSTAKEITIFDVLGKKVFYTESTAKELNISMLSPGVYIIKLEEGVISSTRKLIVR